MLVDIYNNNITNYNLIYIYILYMCRVRVVQQEMILNIIYINKDLSPEYNWSWSWSVLKCILILRSNVAT